MTKSKKGGGPYRLPLHFLQAFKYSKPFRLCRCLFLFVE